MANDFDPTKENQSAETEQNPAIPPSNEQQPPSENPAPADQPPVDAPDAEPDKPAKPKTKAELEAENATLAARNAELEAGNATLAARNAELEGMMATLRKMLPKTVQARAGHQVVFIKSNDVAAVPRDGKKYVQGAVNGVKFEVLCDSQVEVADPIAEALKGVISRQA